MKPNPTALPWIKRSLLLLAYASLAATLYAADEAASPAATNSSPVVTAAPATNVSHEATAAAPAPAPAAAANQPAPPAATSGAVASDTNSTAAVTAPESEPTEPADPDSIRLNFRGVPLEMVLNYLSEAAGFIIVLEAQPRGRVDAWSNKPLTREEAVTLLNTVLTKNGLAAIRKGRSLTIVNRDEAKLKSIPVRMGSDPESIPDTDEMVTQIIPVRYVDATQLIKDLQPLVSVQTPMTANESGNSIVITDTQANIRRVAEVIKAIDMGAEDITEVRVFRLENADPSEMSDLLATLFPDESRTGGGGQGGQGGFRSFMRGMMGGPPGMGGQTSSGSQNQRVRKRARVLAVPDARTASVVVTAAKDLMEQVAQVVTVLDSDPAKRQTVRVFQLENADPQEAAEVLQDIFQKNTTTQNRNGRNQSSVLQNRSDQQQQFNQTSTGIGNNRNSTRRTTSR